MEYVDHSGTGPAQAAVDDAAGGQMVPAQRVDRLQDGVVVAGRRYVTVDALVDIAVVVRCRHARVWGNGEFEHDDAIDALRVVDEELQLQLADADGAICGDSQWPLSICKVILQVGYL